jgi:hypothetical protein
MKLAEKGGVMGGGSIRKTTRPTCNIESSAGEVRREARATRPGLIARSVDHVVRLDVYSRMGREHAWGTNVRGGARKCTLSRRAASIASKITATGPEAAVEQRSAIETPRRRGAGRAFGPRFGPGATRMTVRARGRTPVMADSESGETGRGVCVYVCEQRIEKARTRWDGRRGRARGTCHAVIDREAHGGAGCGTARTCTTRHACGGVLKGGAGIPRRSKEGHTRRCYSCK